MTTYLENQMLQEKNIVPKDNDAFHWYVGAKLVAFSTIDNLADLAKKRVNDFINGTDEMSLQFNRYKTILLDVDGVTPKKEFPYVWYIGKRVVTYTEILTLHAAASARVKEYMDNRMKEFN